MRWGIVGTGAIAGHFALALTRVPGAICTAVASRSEATGRDFARGFGIAAVAGSAGELAARPDVDIVYVATPNTAHVADCLAVIGAGKPVLCEKPLAMDAAGARAVAGAARAAGVFAMEGLWSLCTPAWRAALEAAGSGRIGEVLDFQASFAVPHAPAAMPRLFDAARGGGALLDRGVYLVALARAVLGDLTLAHASGRLSDNGTDLDVALVLEGPGGRRAALDAAIDRMGANTAAISGRVGRILLSEPVNAPRSLRLGRADSAAGFRGPRGRPGVPARLKAALRADPRIRRLHQAFGGGQRWFANGLDQEIAEVERCLAAGLVESPLVPLDGSVRVLEILDEARARLRAF